MRALPAPACGVVRPGRARSRTRLAAGLLALVLGSPGAAHPYSLERLLTLPFERLLQLEISPRKVVRAPERHANTVSRTSSRSRHAA